MHTVRPASATDAADLAPRLRPADRAECLALTGLTAEEALPTFVDPGEAMIAVDEAGVPQVLFGVTPSPDSPLHGHPWLVSSDFISTHRVEFARASVLWLQLFHDRYPLLSNIVDARNTVHIRWLGWLGFSFLRRVDVGHDRRPFYEFARLQ